MKMTLRREGPVAIITWDDGENRINRDSLAALNARLDEVESISGPTALVLSGVGKFFSNGLDLARFELSTSELSDTLSELERTIGRLFVFPAYTVAAVNGHCFAAGALMSCAFDFRVMREDRGYWCMNEAEIGFALDRKLWSILVSRLPRATAVAAVTTAARFSGPDAYKSGIVEALASESAVLERAIDQAGRYAALDRDTLRAHKELAHGDEARYLGFLTG